MRYSASTNGFYPENINYGENLPEDVVDIDDKTYLKLLEGQANGKVISSDSKGEPLLTEKPSATEEETLEINTEKRDRLISDAKSQMFLPQTKLLLGNATSVDKLFLTNWLSYVDALYNVDLSKPVWPEVPES